MIVPSLYLMRSGALYKIGVSTNPERRRRELELASGRHVEILVAREDDLALERESYLHNMYTEFRTIGEWFRLSPVDVRVVARVIADRSSVAEASLYVPEVWA